MQYIEGQQRLIAIGYKAAFEVQVFGYHTKNENDPAKYADDVRNVEKNVFKGKRLGIPVVAGG